MRRTSDIASGRRTGRGRRARDLLLRAELPDSNEGSSDVENLLYFLGDDMREAAMAVGGVERFLMLVQHALVDGPTAPQIDKLLSAADLDGRIGDLEHSLGDLLRNLERLRRALPAGEVSQPDMSADICTDYGAETPNPATSTA